MTKDLTPEFHDAMGRQIYPDYIVVRDGQMWVRGNLTPTQIETLKGIAEHLGERIVVAEMHENGAVFL